MPIPFAPDSINTHIDFTSYMMWHESFMQYNIDTPIICTKNMETQIHDQLKDIYLYGIGYRDIVSVISIPLIIALFAFSFPFIFQMINHINDKYASKRISTMFRSSIRYNLFCTINFLCILFIFVYGVGPLLWKENELIRFSHIWDWMIVSVALFYACVIMLFVKYCIDFNNPDKLLKIIKRKYYFEKCIVWLHQKWIFVKALLRGVVHHKDTEGNSIYKFARNIVSEWNNSVPEDNYISRLIGVVGFAVKKNDFGLFQNVLEGIDIIKDIEKRNSWTYTGNDRKGEIIKESSVHYKTMYFFKELLTIYTPFSSAYMQNESIVFKVVGAFDRTKYMSYVDSRNLAICMRKMLDYGNLTLLEKYIDYTQYYFKYLRELPKVFYVKGGLTDGRTEVEKKSDQSWNVLCCFHYVVLAYAFGKGNYSLLKTHLEREHHSYYNLYPKTGADVLIRYAHCIKDTWLLRDDEMFDRKVDVKSLLSRYTIALLLLVPETESYASEIVTKEIIDTVESSKDDLEKEVNFVKKNAKLLSLYPHWVDINWMDRFNIILGIIKSTNNPIKKENGKGCHILYSVHNFIRRLSGNNIPNIKVPHTNLYTQKLNEKIINDFNLRFRQLGNGFSQFLPNGLFSSILDDKSAEEFLNPCQMVINKLCFLYEEVYSNNLYLTREYVEQISTRFIYLAMSSFRKMKLKKVCVTPPDFDIFFEKFTKGERDNYILIGVDSPFHAILNIRFQGHNRFYKKSVLFVNIDSSMKPLLSDLDNYIYFKDTLLIVAKEDLPAIVDVGEQEDIIVDYKDISDESKLQLNVRVTVDFHKKVVFNSNAKIAMVKLKRMTL